MRVSPTAAPRSRLSHPGRPHAASPLHRIILTLLTFAALALAPTARAQAAESLFIVHFTTGPGWQASLPPPEQKFFREHSANLSRLRRDGRLLIGARYGDKGMIILRATDESAVQAELAQDPSLAAGTFVAQVDAFRPFMPGSTIHLATAEAVALRAYYDAFNRHDADATAALCAEDLRWYSVAGDAVSTDAESRAQLHAWLQGYFAKLPSVRSEVLSLDQAGPFLTVRERASWQDRSGQRVAQQALAVYEIRDGLIRRVWYYPASRDPAPGR